MMALTMTVLLHALTAVICVITVSLSAMEGKDGNGVTLGQF